MPFCKMSLINIFTSSRVPVYDHIAVRQNRRVWVEGGGASDPTIGIMWVGDNIYVGLVDKRARKILKNGYLALIGIGKRVTSH